MIKSGRSHKAPSADQMPVGLIKDNMPEYKRELLEIMNSIYKRNKYLKLLGQLTSYQCQKKVIPKYALNTEPLP